MPFQKGVSGNPKGRQKGKENKTTKEHRELVSAFLDKNADRFQKCMNELTDKEFCAFYIKMLSFVVPKQKPIYYTALDKQDDW